MLFSILIFKSFGMVFFLNKSSIFENLIKPLLVIFFLFIATILIFLSFINLSIIVVSFM